MTDYTRLTIRGTANAADLVLPSDEPLAAMLGHARSPVPFSLYAKPARVVPFSTLDAFLETWTPQACIQPRAGPFGPGWIVSIAYHAGFDLEPSAASAGGCIHEGPAVIAVRVESGLVVDERTGVVYPFGRDLPELGVDELGAFTLGSVRGLERRGAYTRAVREVIELIRAGDAFQVNLAHRLSAEFTGSARALAAHLADRLGPWHGAYLETPSEREGDIAAIVSVSPELFLRLTPEGRVITRPMKGTRAGRASAAELASSAKDGAELAMIVDLMRNDLGRVCAFGSVRVAEGRLVEAHGGSDASPALWQGVATVEGTLRPGLTGRDLIRAAMPPGSVTGAPKVRAMQIIDALEPALGFTGAHARRGAYCGACGFAGDDGSLALNVAIRTAVVTGPSDGRGNVARGEASYAAGAGIVADSDPDSEWNETLDKARAFLGLTGSGGDLAQE